jgi:hypothetical protein
MVNGDAIPAECGERDDVTQAGCSLYPLLATLICRLERAVALGTSVIEWGCPVPSFGNILCARVATVGLNPSNREFVDETGQELAGEFRRFHTLGSLGLESWLDADARHLHEIVASCQQYFAHNPYDTWFKRLEQVTSGAGASFYGPSANACHLDLIPFATARKWTDLTSGQRSSLLSVAADTLALLLRDSPVQVIVLNGRSVVEHFQLMAGFKLQREAIADWTLRRRTGPDVAGFGFRGTVRTLCGIPLQRELLILGYNHNIQSSFGVTRGVLAAIRQWLSLATRKGA